MRQNYNRDTLQRLADEYSLGVIHAHNLFTSGYENSNYGIETGKGKFVLKIFEGDGVKPETVRFEAEVMDTSSRAGVKTPKLYRNKNAELTSLFADTGKLAIAMDFIDGENAAKREISDHVAEELGEQVGKMDAALKIFKDGSLTRQNYEFDGKCFLLLENKLDMVPSDLDKNILRSIFNLFRAIKPTFDSLPAGIIHNDVVLHNILIKGSSLAGIIDFSDMAFSPYIQNIADPMSHIFFTHNWKPWQASLFVKAYRRYNKLSRQELGMLYELTLVRYAVVIVAMSYWNIAYGEDADRTVWVKETYQFMLRFREMGKDSFDKLFV